jgi:6-phosphofructokinase 2
MSEACSEQRGPHVKPIVTLTLNPCIDGASEADAVRPIHKIRTSNERYYPGGGGVNVARVVTELGGSALPVYLGGGATGALLDELLVAAGFAPRRVPIQGHTRISHAVFDRASGLEYRFVPEGPVVSVVEWEAARAAIEALEFDWLVVSGSLPRGLDPGCMGDLVRMAEARGARFVLDTSGAALAAALDAGPVHLVKPSLGEFRTLTGEDVATPQEIGAAAERLRQARGPTLVAVSMAHEGALLAGPGGVTHLRPPQVPVASATGAGDAFLGGMVAALAQGRTAEDAFAFGVAAGTAAVLTPGTDLCRRADVERLYAEIAG